MFYARLSRIKTWPKEVPPLSPISSVRAHSEATSVTPRRDSHVMHLVCPEVSPRELLCSGASKTCTTQANCGVTASIIARVSRA
eukprot:s718_g19.t1